MALTPGYSGPAFLKARAWAPRNFSSACTHSSGAVPAATALISTIRSVTSRPTPVAFAAFSFGSPWLWGIYSKARHRAHLRELGQVDKRTVRFSPARWLLYPVATFAATRNAVWEGITDPAEAVTRWEAKAAARRTAAAGRRAAHPVEHLPLWAKSAWRAPVAAPSSPSPPVTVPPSVEVPTSPATAMPAPAPASSPAAAKARPAARKAPAPTPPTAGDGETPTAIVARLVADGTGFPTIAKAVRSAGHAMADRAIRDLIADARAPREDTP